MMTLNLLSLRGSISHMLFDSELKKFFELEMLGSIYEATLQHSHPSLTDTECQDITVIITPT